MDTAREDAISIARKFRSDEWSPSSACEHYISNIHAQNDRLQAYVQLLQSRAREQALECERAPATSTLSGIPIAIKDVNAIRGTFMRMGSVATRHLYTPLDDILIARLRRAGLVFLGKTSMPEFGVLPITEPTTHPPARNPYDLDITPGGSSGGSAAAVAADLAPISLGSDGGGSIRIPSAFCGLVGFKPSRGLVSNPFGRDTAHFVWTCGPIARSVRDAAALLDILIDPGPKLRGRLFGAFLRYRSGWPLNHQAPSFLSCIEERPRKLRIRYTVEASMPGELEPALRATPAIAAAVERAAELLARAGHDVARGTPLCGTTPDEFLPLWQALVAQAPVFNWENTEPVTRWLGEPGRRIPAAQVHELNVRIRASILNWFGDADVWLTPTVAVDPPAIGAWKNLGPREIYDAAAQIAAFTAVFNITGQPAFSLPAGYTERGIPIGIQLIGRERQDAELFSLAERLAEMLEFDRLSRIKHFANGSARK